MEVWSEALNQHSGSSDVNVLNVVELRGGNGIEVVLNEGACAVNKYIKMGLGSLSLVEGVGLLELRFIRPLVQLFQVSHYLLWQLLRFTID